MTSPRDPRKKPGVPAPGSPSPSHGEWTGDPTYIDPAPEPFAMEDKTVPDEDRAGLLKRRGDPTTDPSAGLPSGALDPWIEVEVAEERGTTARLDGPRRTVELWTQNRIYTLDAQLGCIEVLDRAEREPVQDHPFLGARLVGGQSPSGDQFELSFPFPRPGAEAVFEKSDAKGSRYARTSPVTRVVLRLQVLSVPKSALVPGTSGSKPPSP